VTSIFCISAVFLAGKANFNKFGGFFKKDLNDRFHGTMKSKGLHGFEIPGSVTETPSTVAQGMIFNTR
jgi:hypothetical protein